MNHKNRRPKPFKGCCWMCAKGAPRNRREPTVQEQRALGVADAPAAYCYPWETIEEATLRPVCDGDCDFCLGLDEPGDIVDRFMGLYPGTAVFVERVPSPRVPVLVRMPVMA